MGQIHVGASNGVDAMSENVRVLQDCAAHIVNEHMRLRAAARELAKHSGRYPNPNDFYVLYEWAEINRRLAREVLRILGDKQ